MSKPPDLTALEAEIATTRDAIRQTLQDLQQECAPQKLFNQGIDMFNDTVTSQAGQVGSFIRQNPWPLALIGAGLGWLLWSALKEEDTSRLSSPIAPRGPFPANIGPENINPGAIGDRISTIAEHAVSTANQLGEAAIRQGQNLYERAADQASAANEAAQQLSPKLGKLMHEHPLAVGGLAVISGAVLAALFPTAAVARETRETVTEKAAGVAASAAPVIQRGNEAIHDTIEEARKIHAE